MQVGSLCEGPDRKLMQEGSAGECPWWATLPALGHIRGDRHRHVHTTLPWGHLGHAWTLTWIPPHGPLPSYCGEPEP